jgi:HEPN domain-containing protein
MALDVLYREEAYADVIREAQEIVELLLKGALRWVGVDPPKVHDVGETLKAHQGAFPAFWQEKSDEMARMSTSLFEERGPAFYGDEVGLVPASDLFGREDAERARGWVAEVLGLYERLLEEGK